MSFWAARAGSGGWVDKSEPESSINRRSSYLGAGIAATTSRPNIVFLGKWLMHDGSSCLR